ncbi:MAG: flagellar biosynthesis protein FlhB [Sporomusaceae bacterium]|nr:flagellar biosynthesis protein FlhB [Sporomusaceae bacterium]
MECIRTFIAFSPCSPDRPASFSFDLQRFNGEKTEEATPKRRSEARQKGQVAKSTELNSAFILLSAFFALKMLGPYIYGSLTDFMRHIFSGLADFSTQTVTLQMVSLLFLEISLVLFRIIIPIMLTIAVISLAINFMQVGFTLTFEPLLFKFDRLNPLAGVKRLISKRSLVELAKSLLKIAIIGYFVYRFINREIEFIPGLLGVELIDSLQYIASLTIDLALQIGGVILVLAAIDYSYQWWEHNQSLKMSKQEVKEEFKQTEGNPQIKSKIKERQRAMAMRRMMQEVPTASVVVTNPTHFAVALKYQPDMSAPVIVAKGQDLIAARIKEIARAHKVAVVENKPLARTLYSTAEVGDVVPPHLYQAVAEVLAYVYRLNKKLS